MNDDEKALLTEEEREGMKMIQALQKLAFRDESGEKALVAWQMMTDFERRMTVRTYKMLCQ